MNLSEPDAAVRFDDLDMSALDGLDQLMATHSASNQGAPEQSAPEAASADEEIGPFDIDRYMQRAYDFEQRVRPRAEALYLTAETDRIQSLLKEMPANLPALTGQLSGADMTRWLKDAPAFDARISALIVAIRQLD